MKLLCINHRYAPFIGGSERFAEEVARHRVSCGDDVTVVTTPAFDLESLWSRKKQLVDAPTTEVRDGARVLRTPIRQLPLGAYAFHVIRRAAMLTGQPGWPNGVSARFAQLLPWLPKLRRDLAEVGMVDLVHVTNCGLEGLALAGAEYARQVGARLVITPFFHLGTDPSGYPRRHASLAHQRDLLLQADAVVAMTEHEAAFIEQIGVARKRIVVSGAGVNTHEVSGGNREKFRTQLGVRGVLIGALGAKADDKGTPSLVRAVQQLRSGGADIELVLAGPELQQFADWFDSLPRADRAGIHRLGFIDTDAKRDLLAGLDIFALPSRTESFGIVYLEAWANRIPVIGADLGAVRELVSDGENGLIVPFGNVDALAAAIMCFAHDEAFRASAGRRGNHLVSERFQWRQVLSRVDDAYALALTGPQRQEQR